MFTVHKRVVSSFLASVLICILGACDVLSFTLNGHSTPTSVEHLIPEVIAVHPHDPNAFTQGLLFYENFLYESTGRYGESTLRQVAPETGEVLMSVDMNDSYFGEGLALVDEGLIQLTWREQTGLVYDFAEFAPLHQFSYQGEGWGLCYDGETLYMSDGSPTLTKRDPRTFRATAQIVVMLNGQPVTMLNELECVGNEIYANVWQTNQIVRINKATGIVTAVIDASGLLNEQEILALPQGAVLNGIAYNPDNEHFYITGKLWPRLFEVQFIQ